MISAKFSNIGAVEKTMRQWLASTRGAAKKVAANMAFNALKYAVYMSPQSTGDFASAWKISFGHPDGGNRAMGSGARGQYSQGDMPAISHAVDRAEADLAAYAALPLGTSIHLSNNAAHDEPYAWKVEKGKIKFRPENFTFGEPYNLRAQAIEHVRNRFGAINASRLGSMKAF